jgi:predicted glycosyltransferase
MGHLVRSLALAGGLSASFRVLLLNGGPLPKGIRLPAGVEVIDLPPLGLDSGGELVSRDRRRTVERARALRRGIILRTFRASRPEVLFIELFPFGRKKFADELMPLLEEARGLGPTRPLVVCSLRDILVGRREEQEKHDERAVRVANDYFDAVLVHSDPEFARLEESFQPRTPLGIPVRYTGFVLPDRGAKQITPARLARKVVVSAGGGLVGERLLRTAVESHALLRRGDDVETKVIAGPFLPDEAWQSLRAGARGQKGLRLCRFVPDLVEELRTAVASVSQCGYNTALDILRARVPALVVPFADGAEDEQSKRARRLERLGALRVLEEEQLSAPRLAEEIRALSRFEPRTLELDLDGARNAARILGEMVRPGRSRRVSAREGKRVAREAHV